LTCDDSSSQCTNPGDRTIAGIFARAPEGSAWPGKSPSRRRRADACATKRGSGMREWAGCPYLQSPCRRALSRWGVAAEGCNPVVKQLPLKGIGEGDADTQDARLG
jgi:hypothetical protein